MASNTTLSTDTILRSPNRDPPQSKVWRNTKTAIHVTGIILSICCLAVSLSATGVGDSTFAAYGAGPLSGLTIFWSVVEMIARFVPRLGGTHPALSLSMNCFIWLGTGGFGGWLAALVGEYKPGNPHYCDHNHTDTDSNTCSWYWGDKRTDLIAVVVLLWLMFLTYFILFIDACRTTHKRRIMNSAKVVFDPSYLEDSEGEERSSPLQV